MIKSNYHTHCSLCNRAKGDVLSYVKHAVNFGLEEIGISAHAPISKDLKTSSFTLNMARNLNMSFKTFTKNYLVQIENAKKRYGKQINILKGIETEYFPKVHEYYVMLKNNLDYMNLALHFFLNKEGRIKSVKTLLTIQDIKDYANHAVKAMKTGLFKVFVHPDIFMLTYKSPTIGAEFDRYCEEVTNKIVKAAIENDIYLEISANGVRTSVAHLKTKNWFYPNEGFWKIVATYEDAKVIIGSGAHTTQELFDDAVKAAISFSKELGIKIEEKINFK